MLTVYNIKIEVCVFCKINETTLDNAREERKEGV